MVGLKVGEAVKVGSKVGFIVGSAVGRLEGFVQSWTIMAADNHKMKNGIFDTDSIMNEV